MKKVKNSLPKGAVLVPLFSLFIADLKEKQSRKFEYAEDWALTKWCRTVQASEDVLKTDLKTMGKYFFK